MNIATDALNKQWKESVVELFRGTVQMTPVRTSTLIKGWLIGQTNDGSTGDKIPTITTQQIPDVGGFLLLYNNVPYAVYVEEGTSKMAATAMVATNVRRWQAILRSKRIA
ncbi:MAG: hypothetical protein Tp136SUR676911_49 [Prokaryotic dsDNA virus sp.]|nr:MAG: hypothetical protein Tp136SUR676911_49 [Prokaryotic dsDNA virus sp.]